MHKALKTMPTRSQTLYTLTASVLRRAKRPYDFDEIVEKVLKLDSSFTAFEIKDTIWSLLDAHEASLNDERQLVVVKK